MTDTTKHALFRKIEPFQSEAAFLIQIFPRETEFMNNALWSPRGARAGERTHVADDTKGDLSNATTFKFFKITYIAVVKKRT